MPKKKSIFTFFKVHMALFFFYVLFSVLLDFFWIKHNIRLLCEDTLTPWLFIVPFTFKIISVHQLYYKNISFYKYLGYAILLSYLCMVLVFFFHSGPSFSPGVNTLFTVLFGLLWFVYAKRSSKFKAIFGLPPLVQQDPDNGAPMCTARQQPNAGAPEAPASVPENKTPD